MKQRFLRKMIAVVGCIWMALLGTNMDVAAQVTATEEVTGPADCIYVAGNPDLFPVEYYSEESKMYEGVMPEIFEIISEKTDRDFVYVSAGKKNQQKELAKNLQVELVSAYMPEEIKDLENETLLQIKTTDGKTRDICIGFTKIASPKMKEQITEAIREIDAQEIAGITITYVMEHGKKVRLSPTLIGITVVSIILCMLFLFYEIRQRKRIRQSEQEQMKDSLTGIGNGDYLTYFYNNYIASQAAGLYYMVYLGMNIDHIRKYQGEQEAEEVQRYTALVLFQSESEGEVSVRLGDGTFAMLFQRGSEEDAQEHIDRIMKELEQYCIKFQKDYKFDIHAGVYYLGKDKGECESAVFSAKQGYLYACIHHLPYSFSNEKMLDHAEKIPKLQLEVQDAVKKKEIQPYLQFIVNKETKEVCGAEMLSRWQHPREGLLSPGKYIGIMHQSGVIEQLDYYMIEEGCRLLEEWKKQGYGHWHVTCNLTRTTITQPEFLKKFSNIIEKYQIDRSLLWIEITEDSLGENNALIRENALACRKKGVRIVLDDFGSVYTSLSDLCDFTVDCVKIDRHIIQKSVEPTGKKLLKGICRLAHEMDIKVLCEGVETEEENAAMEDIECEYIQGFYYSRVYPKEYAMESLNLENI